MRYAAIGISAVVLSSCVMVVVQTPEIHGKVIDGRTGAPIGNAEVSIRELPGVVTRTNAEGDFGLPAKSAWGVLPPVADVVVGYPMRGTITIKAEPYKLLESPKHRTSALGDPKVMTVVYELERE